MNRIVLLLERIVLALKQVVNRAYPRVPVTETSQSSPATEENVGDLQSDIYPPPVTETSQNSPATEENVRDLWSDRCPPPFSILESFLSSQGIRIKVRPAEDASDQVIDSLSLYLANTTTLSPVSTAKSSAQCKLECQLLKDWRTVPSTMPAQYAGSARASAPLTFSRSINTTDRAI